MSREHKSSLTVRVLSAIAMLGSAQAVNIICSVIRAKLIAVWLGPVGVGLNTILVNGSNLVSTATQLNLRDSSVRDLSLHMSARSTLGHHSRSGAQCYRLQRLAELFALFRRSGSGCVLRRILRRRICCHAGSRPP